MDYCDTCNITEAGHFTECFGTFTCIYQDIRDVLWLAKINNEGGIT